MIMRSEHLMSSVFRLAGGQFSTLLYGKKGGEKFLPKCVHFHVAKSKESFHVGIEPGDWGTQCDPN